MLYSGVVLLDSTRPAQPEGLEWRKNLSPSLVVFLLSVPLSMGIAIASGVPPARGMVTAIVGGLLVGSLTSTRLQISGPSAGMAVMVLDVVLDHGLSSLAVIVPLMGLLQMIAGRLKLGQVFRAVAPAVIDGMLAGIGILIFAAQFHVMVDDAPKATGWENLLSIPHAMIKGLYPMDSSVHHLAAMIGVLTLVALVLSRSLQRGPWRHVPAPLVAVGVSTLAVWALALPIQRVKMPDSLWAAIVPPTTETLGRVLEPSIWVSALALAFVASAETLLCATAVDSMHEGKRADYDRELFVQGLGNLTCGVLGAPPMAGVITRSTPNVQAGATSPASAILVGGWLLLIMLLFPTALQVIPRASLAGLLVYVGYKLVKTRPLRELRWYGRSELFIFGATVIVIVTVNLLSGIVTGLLLAAAKLIYSRGKSFHRLEIRIEDEPRFARTHLHLRGAASFLRLPRLATALERLPLEREVHLHFEELEYIDHACLNLLEKWEASRTRVRAPVRVMWNRLRYRYHAGNRLDATPEEHSISPEEEIRLMEFLTPANILIDPALPNKQRALEVLAERMAALYPAVASPERILDSALRRENEASTYMGSGLMIPHARLKGYGALHGVLAISKTGWYWKELDKRIHCVLLLHTAENQATRHLAIVAGFARLFTMVPELRARLLDATTPEEAFCTLTGPDAEAVNTVVESRRSSEFDPIETPRPSELPQVVAAGSTTDSTATVPLGAAQAELKDAAQAELKASIRPRNE